MAIVLQGGKLLITPSWEDQENENRWLVPGIVKSKGDGQMFTDTHPASLLDKPGVEQLSDDLENPADDGSDVL